MPLSAGQRAIVVWLRANLRTGPHSPRAIADGTGLKRATVRKEMTRLSQAENPAIIQVQPGYYRAFIDAQELAQFQAPLPAVHHVHIHVALPQNGVTGVGARLIQQTLDGAPSTREVAENGSVLREDWFEGRKVTFSIYDAARLAVVQLRATDAPLDAETWKRYLAYLRGTFGAWGVNIETAAVNVVQADIGVDVHGLRIEGANAISLRRWSDAFLRVYNKADRLRFEVASAHSCTPTEISAMLETFYDRSTVGPGAAGGPRPMDPNDPGFT